MLVHLAERVAIIVAQEKKAEQNASPNREELKQREWLTVQEAAYVYDIAPCWLYERTRLKPAPEWCWRLGRHVRIRRALFEATDHA